MQRDTVPRGAAGARGRVRAISRSGWPGSGGRCSSCLCRSRLQRTPSVLAGTGFLAHLIGPEAAQGFTRCSSWGGALVRVPQNGSALPRRSGAHRKLVGRHRPARAATLVDRRGSGPPGRRRIMARHLRRHRRDDRGGAGTGAGRTARTLAPHRHAARTGASAGAARVGAAGEPGPVPIPDQVRDPGALRPRGVRALRHVADPAARRVARAPRAAVRHRDARVRGTRGFRARRTRLARTLERSRSQALYGSFTLLGVGLYLLGVGLSARH